MRISKCYALFSSLFWSLMKHIQIISLIDANFRVWFVKIIVILLFNRLMIFGSLWETLLLNWSRKLLFIPFFWLIIRIPRMERCLFVFGICILFSNRGLDFLWVLSFLLFIAFSDLSTWRLSFAKVQLLHFCFLKLCIVLNWFFGKFAYVIRVLYVWHKHSSKFLPVLAIQAVLVELLSLLPSEMASARTKIYCRLITLSDISITWWNVILLIYNNLWLVIVINIALLRTALTLHTRVPLRILSRRLSATAILIFPDPACAFIIIFIARHTMKMLIILLMLLYHLILMIYFLNKWMNFIHHW